MAADLERLLDWNVDPVACPERGWYQTEMIQSVREAAYARAQWAFWTMAVVVGFVGFLMIDKIVPTNNLPGYFVMVVGCAIAVSGVILVARWKSTYEPNAGHPGPGRVRSDLTSASRGVLKTEYERRLASSSQEEPLK